MATIWKTVLEMEVEEADRIEHIGDCHIKSFNGQTRRNVELVFLW